MLRPCPLCEEPLVMIDGKNQTPVTFWADNGTACMTPHADGCELHNQPIPDGLDLIGLLHEKRMRETR